MVNVAVQEARVTPTRLATLSAGSMDHARVHYHVPSLLKHVSVMRGQRVGTCLVSHLPHHLHHYSFFHFLPPTRPSGAGHHGADGHYYVFRKSTHGASGCPHGTGSSGLDARHSMVSGSV